MIGRHNTTGPLVTAGLLLLLAADLAVALGAQKVLVVVHVPTDIPATESVYLAGSLPGAGDWKADGMKLSRQADGAWTGDIELDTGQTLKFKFTRGSWETVEKNADGSERANRSVTINASTRQIEVTIEKWATGGVQKTSTVVGTLKLHTLEPTTLKLPRTIRVWLPSGSDTPPVDPAVRYRVLYLQDGQNCFDRATSAFGQEWEVDETLTKLIADKAIPPLIVVGVDNGQTDRIKEYTYPIDLRRGGGQAEIYAKFLLGEVKPFIDKTYRTHTDQAHTFIGGSSLGGLFSLEIARRHPHTFGGVLAMSPSLWWSNRQLIHDIEIDASGFAQTRVWIDIGTAETSTGDGATEQMKRFVDDARRLAAILDHQRVEHRLLIEDSAEHNEPAWARRFPRAIFYLMNGR